MDTAKLITRLEWMKLAGIVTLISFPAILVISILSGSSSSSAFWYVYHGVAMLIGLVYIYFMYSLVLLGRHFSHERVSRWAMIVIYVELAYVLSELVILLGYETAGALLQLSTVIGYGVGFIGLGRQLRDNFPELGEYGAKAGKHSLITGWFFVTLIGAIVGVIFYFIAYIYTLLALGKAISALRNSA